MNHNILDAQESPKDPERANKSIRFLLLGVLTYLLLFLYGVLVVRYNPEKEWIAMLSLLIGLAAFILTLIGLISGVKSVLRKEKSNLKKFIGLIGNFFLVFIMSLVIFANVLDILRWMNT